jgi:hypothetical protein
VSETSQPSFHFLSFYTKTGFLGRRAGLCLLSSPQVSVMLPEAPKNTKTEAANFLRLKTQNWHINIFTEFCKFRPVKGKVRNTRKTLH